MKLGENETKSNHYLPLTISSSTFVSAYEAYRTAPDTQQLLNAFPLANGTSSANGFSEFAASFSNPARHDTGNVRIDVNLTDHFNVNGRYSFTDSDANQRGAGGFSLNTINKTTSFAQTFTGAFTFVLSPRIVLDFHANYSRLAAEGAYSLDDFGGSLIPSELVSQGTNFTLDLNGRNSSWKLGNPVSSIQRQFNTVGNFVAVEGHHSYKIGIDYRRVSPIIGLRDREQSIFFDGVDQLLTGVANRLSVFNHIGPQEPVFNNFSLYAQDEWKQSTRLTINYGVRWELDPSPHSNPNALAVDQIVFPQSISPHADRHSGKRPISTSHHALVQRMSCREPAVASWSCAAVSVCFSIRDRSEPGKLSLIRSHF